MFFLATADAEGQPDVRTRAAMPGFVRVVDEQTLAFPDYDGNGMFKSLGNILVNPKVGLLFIDFEQPHRMRVNGTASVADADPLLAEFPGAQLIVRVHAERIFPNCPRYIHQMSWSSTRCTRRGPGYEPPEPDWKQKEVFRDALPHTVAGSAG